MAKINYALVEAQLLDGLRGWALERLRQQARLLQQARQETPKAPSPVEKPVPISERAHTLHNLKRDLDLLYLRDKSIYRKLGFPYRHFKFAIAMRDLLTEPQWQKILNLRQKLDTHIASNPFKTEEGKSETPDESLVEAERIKHKSRKHNVRSDWLPS